MAEFSFKSLCVLVIVIVAFIAFKAGSFFGSMDDVSQNDSVQIIQLNTDNIRKSDVEITSMDFDVIGEDGNTGFNVWSKVVLPSGKHSYRLNYFFYDENGDPIKDENGLHNIKEYVGGIGQLGEQNIPVNQSRTIENSFFLPYDELHLKKFGHVQLYVNARLIQDDKEILVESPAFGFVVIHSK